MRGQLVELRAGARMTIGGSSERAAKDWQREADGHALLERGDDGDPGGEVAEHLAEPGLVEARHACAAYALPRSIDWDSCADETSSMCLGLGEPAGLVQDAVELPVGVRGVVVREEEPLHPRLGRHVHGVGGGRVAPVGLGRELVVGVLAVVDQQVHVLAELEHGLGDGAAVERRLVVGHVGHGAALGLDPVAERHARHAGWAGP